MHAAIDPTPLHVPPAVYRVWVTHYRDWHPASWLDVPPVAVAIEPVSDATFSAEDAELFLQGFNSQLLQDTRGLWAVAVPITLRFEGDLHPGEEIAASACATLVTGEEESSPDYRSDDGMTQ
jgi:hypothetical protein